jgi:hypothetical protein
LVLNTSVTRAHSTRYYLSTPNPITYIHTPRTFMYPALGPTVLP